MAAGFLLPWLASGTDTLDRASLAGSGIDYERALASWPLWGFGTAGLSFALAAYTRLVPRGQATAWIMAAAGSFVALLTGTRWLGFQIGRWLDAGPPLVHLHIIPWLHLLVGTGFLGLASWACLKRIPSGVAPALLAAATLLVMPLVPLGTIDGFHVDELTLAVAGQTGSAFEDVARSHEMARAGLWLAAAPGLVAAVAAQWMPSRLRPWLDWSPALSLPGLALAIAATGRFHWQWLQHDGLSMPWNPLLAMGCIAATFAALRLLWHRSAALRAPAQEPSP